MLLLQKKMLLLLAKVNDQYRPIMPVTINMTLRKS